MSEWGLRRRRPGDAIIVAPAANYQGWDDAYEESRLVAVVGRMRSQVRRYVGPSRLVSKEGYHEEHGVD